MKDTRKVWKNFLWREKAVTFKRAKNGIGQVRNEKMQETDQGQRIPRLSLHPFSRSQLVKYSLSFFS